ncbi:butyrate kinase [Staphylococcus simulans]|uniref:butyrate kinase n=1 Tax=Staphylococcus simulans TaxID=1286 RepID=UPI001E453F96|nr:butyrate kinase [Staphylococcus simulans]MCD8915058.1 butyrate kinase [Staphylococcus simulans]
MTNILVINLGSTSSKIAFFKNKQCAAIETIQHDITITQKPLLEQEPYRIEAIKAFIEASTPGLNSIDAIACRGGLLKPIAGGTYAVNKAMYDDLRHFKYGVHASNLSGIIGYNLGHTLNVPVYIVDPVVVDELVDIARMTGIKGIHRRSVFHALNQKAVARKFAQSQNKKYDEVNVIVAHMGGGITIGAHLQGKVADVNEGLYGEGPLSPERAGSIPNDLLYQFGHTHHYSPEELNHFISKQAGIMSLYETNNIQALVKRYEQDSEVRLILDTMIYQIAKAIGERAVIFKGRTDQIILTGGIAYSSLITNKIAEYTNWIAPVTVYPGELEMESLANRVYETVNLQESVKQYS